MLLDIGKKGREDEEICEDIQRCASCFGTQMYQEWSGMLYVPCWTCERNVFGISGRLVSWQFENDSVKCVAKVLYVLGDGSHGPRECRVKAM